MDADPTHFTDRPLSSSLHHHAPATGIAGLVRCATAAAADLGITID